MTRSLKLTLRRHMDPGAFRAQLAQLKAFRGSHIGPGLLERLDAEGILPPRVRLLWPEAVARRFWSETHDGVGAMTGSLEPDGPQWDAAVALRNTLIKIRSPRVYGPIANPIDDPAPEFAPFVRRPTTGSSRNWSWCCFGRPP